MADETWEGTGIDPWMPRQLADQMDAEIAESHIRNAIWKALSVWLIAVLSAIFRHRIPDLTAIYTKDAVWRDAVKTIVNGPIKTEMLRMYTDLLGDDDWSKRAMVTTHLAQVTDRLMRLPDSVYNMLNQELTTTTQTGGDLNQVVKHLEQVLATSDKRWDVKANLLARNETMSALNAGRADAFTIAAERVGSLDQIWLTVRDIRVRATHRSAHGQTVPVGQPFTVGDVPLRFPCDPMGPAEETAQCRCRARLVEPGTTNDVTNQVKG